MYPTVTNRGAFWTIFGRSGSDGSADKLYKVTEAVDGPDLEFRKARSDPMSASTTFRRLRYGLAIVKLASCASTEPTRCREAMAEEQWRLAKENLTDGSECDESYNLKPKKIRKARRSEE